MKSKMLIIIIMVITYLATNQLTSKNTINASIIKIIKLKIKTQFFGNTQNPT